MESCFVSQAFIIQINPFGVLSIMAVKGSRVCYTSRSEDRIRNKFDYSSKYKGSCKLLHLFLMQL